MLENVSLIIPSQNAESNLFNLLGAIPSWRAVPNEIIIVDSSENKIDIPQDIKHWAKKLNINLLIFHEENLYPGHARNFGIHHSKNELLAFLDTSTFPSEEWLSNGLNLMKSNNSEGVWGSTFYQADKFSIRIFRACTYGAVPMRTFPGTMLRKNVFNKCGLFVETVRAGEDADWIGRAELHKIHILTPKESLSYSELNHANLRFLIYKWFRNYVFSAKLPFFRAHKDLYYYSASLILILVAYNWNRVLASWDSQSFFFIPNITKISILIIIILYTFFRGIYLPAKKGETLKFILPINFIFITFLSVLIDVTKMTAFVYTKFFKLKNR